MHAGRSGHARAKGWLPQADRQLCWEGLHAIQEVHEVVLLGALLSCVCLSRARPHPPTRPKTRFFLGQLRLIAMVIVGCPWSFLEFCSLKLAAARVRACMHRRWRSWQIANQYRKQQQVVIHAYIALASRSLLLLPWRHAAVGQGRRRHLWPDRLG